LDEVTAGDAELDTVYWIWLCTVVKKRVVLNPFHRQAASTFSLAWLMNSPISCEYVADKSVIGDSLKFKRTFCTACRYVNEAIEAL
jgi:hypothetical protein